MKGSLQLSELCVVAQTVEWLPSAASDFVQAEIFGINNLTFQWLGLVGLWPCWGGGGQAPFYPRNSFPA